MYCGSPSSVTQAENCAESATTDAPQMLATASSSHGSAPKSSPIVKEHAPLIPIAHEVVSVRPALSPKRPPATQPISPAPITRKDAASARAGAAPLCARLARIITGDQVH